jgi:cell division transport system ATP-binding protein
MLVTFDAVSKQYGNKSIGLSDVSFSAETGEFIFLVGKSGAGKTTILRLLIKDLIATSGKIMVEDLEVTKLPKKMIPQLRRKIGMVFQDFKLLADRTIGENVAITLEIAGKHKNEIDKKVEEVLYLVGLKDKSLLFPAQLSAGEMQRAAIARAIIGGPKMLLADEPTGNLDPITSWEILKILKEINKLGTTILMATHNADIVNSMKKRVIVLDKGKIIKDQKVGKYR